MMPSLGRLKTHVARRLLGLFTLSAFLPVAAMAVGSLLVVNRQLEEQSRERLRQLAKNSGMSVLQQLQSVETGLLFLAEGNGFEKTPDATLQEGTSEIRAFAVVDADGSVRVSRGRPFPRPTLDPPQRAVLSSGRMVVVGTDGPDGDVVTVLAPRPDDPGGALIWALVDAGPLWSPAVTFASLPTVAEFCLLGPGGSPAYCRSGDSLLAVAFQDEAPSGPLGTFTWQGSDDRYIIGHWAFHPPGTAGGPPWHVLIAESSRGFRAPIADFSTSFVLVLLLGLSMVFLLANAQIRRTTDPLAALDAGTRRVASGDLSTRVEVDTADEFGALAGSFNTMADHLLEQFTQLDAARAVDRAVLTAFDTDDVVQTILERIPALVPCRSAGVLLADRGGRPRRAPLADLGPLPRGHDRAPRRTRTSRGSRRIRATASSTARVRRSRGPSASAWGPDRCWSSLWS